MPDHLGDQVFSPGTSRAPLRPCSAAACRWCGDDALGARGRKEAEGVGRTTKERGRGGYRGLFAPRRESRCCYRSLGRERAAMRAPIPETLVVQRIIGWAVRHWFMGEGSPVRTPLPYGSVRRSVNLTKVSR